MANSLADMIVCLFFFLMLLLLTAGEIDSDDDDDDDLEAAQLEKMVAKLARIVKHVIPNRSIELDENVDKNTSNWLAQVNLMCPYLVVWPIFHLLLLMPFSCFVQQFNPFSNNDEPCSFNPFIYPSNNLLPW
jgi:hypothetical protein